MIASAPAPYRLHMQGIRKAFPGVQALDGVDFEVRAGEVHVLLGENGAGKSTLMRILAGGTSRDAGRIDIDGVPVTLDSPRAAQDAGIAIIHQELLLVPELSVAENIYLGRFPQAFGVVDRRAMHEGAQATVRLLDDSIDVRRPVSSLSLAQQQLVEIARALSLQARLLVMDVPT
jgi:ribose transport system ATP-binding protein